MEVNVSTSITNMPSDFTFSFWLMLLEDGYDAIRN
jgi:hypothetical protein